ncbi:hypothetical protein [Psychromonas sp. SA13A]|uniref:hypothetical protein n=1 Tax=Psychromonas sp. SA13A TaxID=2686346 RepID=UPI00140E717D|nr:hypothetical protein [Psychromonas sp. SA13A]
MKIKRRSPLPSLHNMFVEREECPLDGSFSYSFFHGQTPYRHLVLNSEIALKLAAYHLIEKDLNSAYASIKCLMELQEKASIDDLRGIGNHENTQFVIAKSLHQAAIVTYGKCFASSTGGKAKSSKKKSRGVKLDKKIISDFPLEQIEIHNFLIETRNEYVAHGGATNLEQSLSFVLVSPQNTIISDVHCLEAHSGGVDYDQYKIILDLITSVKKVLRVMQNKKNELIIKSHLTQMTAEEISAESIFTSTLSIG